MSYNGTVHCRHCYGKGHNRRTCPQLTDQYKRRAVAELENNEGREGYWHVEYAKRTGYWLDAETHENGEKATELKRSRAGGTRRCKYCAKTGHNKRTCPELKEAKATAIAETAAVRQAVLDGLAAQGLGVGALVTMNTHADQRVGYIVTGFHWDHLTAQNAGHNPNIVQLRALNPAQVSRWQQETGCPLPPIEGVNENSWNQLELVGPVSGSAALLTAPEGWVEDQSWVDGQFAEAQSPNWHDNRYDY